METKWLTIQSFKRNQSLIDDINTLLLYYKLTKVNQKSLIKETEIAIVINRLKAFIEKIIDFTKDEKQIALVGADYRLRAFVRSFMDAKKQKRTFKSRLFRDTPQDLINIIENPRNELDYDSIISSLSELRVILENHNSVDLRDIIEGI